MAMTGNFLREPSPNHVAHNATSSYFVTNPSLSDWALFMAEASAPTAAKLVEATEKWSATTVQTETAFNLAMNSDVPFFTYRSESPDLTKRFAGYMKNMTTSEGTNVKHLLNGFDWASLGEAIVVDVGGSSGHASIALAFAYPKLKLIVQDLPEVISTAKTNLSSLPESMASRISFQGHDFFGSQLARDADIYLLRMILHDWPVKEATSILANLIPSLKPGARILIMDTVLPVSGSIPASEESLVISP